MYTGVCLIAAVVSGLFIQNEAVQLIACCIAMAIYWLAEEVY